MNHLLHARVKKVTLPRLATISKEPILESTTLARPRLPPTSGCATPPWAPHGPATHTTTTRCSSLRGAHSRPTASPHPLASTRGGQRPNHHRPPSCDASAPEQTCRVPGRDDRSSEGATAPEQRAYRGRPGGATCPPKRRGQPEQRVRCRGRRRGCRGAPSGPLWGLHGRAALLGKEKRVFRKLLASAGCLTGLLVALVAKFHVLRNASNIVLTRE